MKCDRMIHKDLNTEDKTASHKTMEKKLNQKFRIFDPNDPKMFIFNKQEMCKIDRIQNF